MIAALYVRVSTEEQALEGFSIAAQIKLLKEYCVKENIVIYKVYADEGITGTIEKRPQFQLMIKDAENKYFDVVLVHKYDRFARSTEISTRIENQINKAGIVLISITEPVPDNPFGFLQKRMMQLWSEFFVKNLSAEVKKGLVERASQGLYTGFVPYGYKIKNGTVIVEPKQAEIVKKIFDLYLSGMGYRGIAVWLNQNKIPTSKPGGTWGQYQVSYILTNVRYIGKLYYAGKTYEGQQAAIIDEDLFNTVQAHKKKKHDEYTYAKRGSNFNKYLLLGLLHCGECGNAYRVIVNKRYNHGKQYNTYICNLAAQYKLQCGNTKHYKTHLLEEDIEEYIEKVLMEKEPLIYDTPEIDTNKILQDRKEKIERELNRAREAYIQEIFTLEEYEGIKKRSINELKEIDVTMIKETKVNSKDKAMYKKLKIAYQQYKKAKTIEDKKKILFGVIRRIELTRRSLEITFYM